MRQERRVPDDLVQGPKGDLAQNIRPVMDDVQAAELEASAAGAD